MSDTDLKVRDDGKEDHGHSEKLKLKFLLAFGTTKKEFLNFQSQLQTCPWNILPYVDSFVDGLQENDTNGMLTTCCSEYELKF